MTETGHQGRTCQRNGLRTLPRWPWLSLDCGAGRAGGLWEEELETTHRDLGKKPGLNPQGPKLGVWKAGASSPLSIPSPGPEAGP